MEIILNNIAIWKPKIIDQFTIKKEPAGRKHQKVGSNLIVVLDEPVYRYAKNYQSDGVKYCLFVRSTTNAPKSIEKQLDNIAEDITGDQARKMTAGASFDTFTYLNQYIEGEAES